ncbi:hypothetical protein HHK36_001999 [Tetracentron sinense]|uniref:Uncharacterized protein n=1 Tax=Tetracentron sinense TaxID=13715 RepID=A0A835DS32_TETSI|nr:hypothetical protein HHK36_001999 [Tetracentron sinense]
MQETAQAVGDGYDNFRFCKIPLGQRQEAAWAVAANFYGMVESKVRAPSSNGCRGTKLAVSVSMIDQVKESILSYDDRILEKNDQAPATVADCEVHSLSSFGNFIALSQF